MLTREEIETGIGHISAKLRRPGLSGFERIDLSEERKDLRVMLANLDEIETAKVEDSAA